MAYPVESHGTDKRPPFLGTMKARYTGRCHNCGKIIGVGDDITSDFDVWTEKWKAVHDDCGILAPPSLRNYPDNYQSY